MTYSSYATRVATRGGYISQMGSTVKAKWSLKHLGPKIWDSIDPSLYDISLPAFKRQLKDKLVNEYSGWLSYMMQEMTLRLGLYNLDLR